MGKILPIESETVIFGSHIIIGQKINQMQHTLSKNKKLLNMHSENFSNFIDSID